MCCNFILLFEVCSDIAAVLLLQVSDLLLRSVKCVDVPEWFIDSCGILCTAEVSDSTLLFLCHGALAMLEWKNNSMGQNGEKLLLDIVLVLLSLNSR